MERFRYSIIARNVSVITVIDIVGKVFGYIRTIVIASLFGANARTDAFVIAFAIPRFFLGVLGGGTLTAAFVPVFKTYIGRDEEREAWNLARGILNIIFILVGLLSIAGIILAPLIVPFFAPGFEKEIIGLTTTLTRIIFPALIFFCSAAIVKAILNAQHRFAVPSLTPLVLNISIIVCALILTPFIGIMSLAIGVVVGSIGQLLIQWPSLIRSGMRYSPSTIFHPGIKEVLYLFIPLLGGVAVHRLDGFVARIFASMLEEGSISALYFAEIIAGAPVSVFGISIATVIFPIFVERAVDENFEKLKETLLKSVRMVVYITAPIMIGLIVIRMPLIRLLFERGEFTGEATLKTATALMYFAIGSVAIASSHIMVRGFHALKDTKTPVIVSAIALTSNIILNIILVRPMGLGGIALATSLSALIEVVFLMAFLCNKLKGLNLTFLLSGLAKILISASVMGGICHLSVSFFEQYLDIKIFWNLLLQLSGAVVLSFIAYVLMSLLLKVEEFGKFVEMFMKKERALR